MLPKRLVILVAALALLPATASAQVGIRLGIGGIGLGFSPPIARERERPERVERHRAPQKTERVRRKQNDDDDVKTAKKTPAVEEAKEPEAPKVAKGESENSSVSVGVAEKDKAEVTKTAATENPGASIDNENSTITSATIVGAESTTKEPEPVKVPLTTADTAADGKPAALCRRYIPTAGQTISVPCD